MKIQEAQEWVVTALKQCEFNVVSAKDGEIIAKKVLKTRVDRTFVFITEPKACLDGALHLSIHMPELGCRNEIIRDEVGIINHVFDTFNPKFPAKRRRRSK